jgi:hypothetical protein
VNLYDIATDYVQLQQLVEEIEGSGEEIDESLASAFEAANGDLKAKTDAVLKMIRNYEAKSLMLANEAKVFQKKAKSAEKGADRLRGMLKRILTMYSLEKIKTDRFTVSSCKSSRPRVSFNIEKMPQQYLKQVWIIDPDRKEEAATEAAINEPEWATVEHGTHLRIS